MNDEIFTKFEYIPQTGDDGLPRDLLQIDFEQKRESLKTASGFEYIHIGRAFVDPDNLLRFLIEKTSPKNS